MTQSSSGRVVEITVALRDPPARVFVGGSGTPLLLVHGGWGGASLHWASVWEQLAERYRIVAPDLPGIGHTDQPALPSLAAYSDWIDDLMRALDVEDAWCVGNSFGASIVCELAAKHPRRCRGLVLVNGIPLPRSPGMLRWLGQRRVGHAVMRWVERRVAYTPAAVKRGFSDPERAPAELVGMVTGDRAAPLDAFASILVEGGSGAACPKSPLLLWGENDHLPGTTRRAAQRLHSSWPGSELAFVANAGHMPQLENPSAFVAKLLAFLDAHPSRAESTGSATPS